MKIADIQTLVCHPRMCVAEGIPVRVLADRGLGIEAHTTDDDPVWLGPAEVRATWIELNLAVPPHPAQCPCRAAESAKQPQVAMRLRPPAGGVSDAH